jgi:hypothetical protein
MPVEEAEAGAAAAVEETAAPVSGIQAQVIQGEFILDTHRVRGELRYQGVPRRLVDMLNSMDGAYLLLHDGEIEDPFADSPAPHRFEVAQMHREAILLAVPRGDAPQGDRLEAVRKTPVPATVVIPGFDISGHIYLLPEADAAKAPVLSSRHFAPMTDATITAAHGRGHSWREPVVLVNLARALLYAPNPRRG